MTTLAWVLTITIYSGGAMGGQIGYKEATFATYQECKQVLDTVKIEQSSTVANGENTHTVVAVCLPKEKK